MPTVDMNKSLLVKQNFPTGSYQAAWDCKALDPSDTLGVLESVFQAYQPKLGLSAPQFKIDVDHVYIRFESIESHFDLLKQTNYPVSQQVYEDVQKTHKQELNQPERSESFRQMLIEISKLLKAQPLWIKRFN